MKFTSIGFYACLILILSACSETLEPSDEVIKKGFELLKENYSLAVKPRDAYSTKCTYAQSEERHFALCGADYGGTQLVRRGKWEILNEKGAPVLLALNGKASTALDKILAYSTDQGIHSNFKVGYGRPPIPSNVFPD